MHDTLGHTMTAMTVQATAARRLLAADPAAAERAMAAVEELGRRAQSDIDQVVGTLRDAATASTQAPEDRDGSTDLVAALVKTHVRSLLAKSGSRHRTELVVRAYEAGLLRHDR